jgi:hypothetical protein
MHVRLSTRIATFGLIGTAALTACKSDGGTGPNTSGESFANPTGLLKVGDILSLNVNLDDACTNGVYHAARVVAVGSRSVIFADTLNPKNGFTTTDYQKFAAKFDTLIYPMDVENFGDPTDVDKNGNRISIVFTQAVNLLTPPRSGQYVGGLAFSRDLFPKVGTANGRAATCPGSNEGEYFYAMTPDPTGSINSNVRTTGFVDSTTAGVLAHELQHIINSSRRLYVNKADAFEEKWLDEGLAHMAEELLFYREAGLAPRLNLDVNSLRASNRILSAYNLEMAGNTTRYRTYLSAPSLNSPYAPNDSLQTRGAAWSLLRYSLDRVNASDNFTAGNGQSVSGAGDVVISSGATTGEFIATIVNTSLQQNGNTNFTLKSTSTNGDVITATDFVPSYLRVPVAGESDRSTRDEAVESRVRTREREELTPKMSAARAWYAAREGGSTTMSPSRSLSRTGTADADGTLLFKLVNNNLVGIPNYQTIVGGDAAGFVRDWVVSHAIDDVAALTTQYQQRSWNWHSIYPAILTSGTYPLSVATLSVNGSSSGSLVPGGAAYYRVTVAAGGTATINLSVPNGTSPNNLQLVIVRTK